ncbi:tRNA1(Val) (adenine(37)-N6)-methyltransferase [Segnochrobactraceae bacterium EtOH-i3]
MTGTPEKLSAAPEAGPEIETSCDRFLNGRCAVLQPRKGRHRSGHDAILLAATVPADARGRVVDLGAGVGVAGLALAVRVPALAVTLAERDPVAVALAQRSLALPENAAVRGRVRVVEADVTAPAAVRQAAGLGRETAEHVILNPPFYPAGSVRSATAERAAAHVLAEDGLERWLRTAADLLVAGGRVHLIFPASGLKTALDALDGRFGALRIRPVQARLGGDAIRVLVGGVKGSRAPLGLGAPLVLHEASGAGPSAEAAAILAGDAGIDLG